MTLPIWALVAIVVLTAAVVGAVGFLLGRKTAADSKRIADLETELSTQRGALESVNAGINAHFEESAKLFGQLAQDYRAFFEHFTSTASTLGLSERRAQAIRVAVETELLPKDADSDVDEDRVAEVSLEQPQGVQSANAPNDAQAAQPNAQRKEAAG